METFNFGSVAGSLAASAFFGAVVLLMAWIAYRLLARRPDFEGELPYACSSRRCRLVGAAVLAVVLGTALHTWLWSVFYRLDLSEEAVTLHFHAPARTRTIPRADIVRVRWGGDGKTSRVVVEVRGGAVYRSAPARGRERYAALLGR